VKFTVPGGVAVLSALLVGCSTVAQTAPSVPIAPPNQSAGRFADAPHLLAAGRMSASKLLELQVAGKLPGFAPHNVMLAILHEAQAHQRPMFPSKRRGKSGTVALWTSLTGYNYLLGQSIKLNDTVGAIDTGTNSCFTPVTVKVDGSRNIWTACQDGQTGTSSYQEYTAAGVYTASYNEACPAPVSTCSYFYGYGSDGAANATNVFSTLTTYEEEVCDPKCAYVDGAGFEYWPAGSPTTSPTLIAASPYGKPVDDVYYMDLDGSGNIWFDYYGCSSSKTCGYGIGEITDPTTSATFVSIAAPGTLQYPGGVYASAGGTTINVIDQESRAVYQYNTSGTLTATLGPTGILGDPISGGFNAKDAHMAIGDSFEVLDVGVVASNTWKPARAPYFIGPLAGAAYTPSDK
jgi:hypothetical protein